MDNVRRGMRAKSIKSVLRAIIDEWIASIDDARVRSLAADNTIVTGGCIASMLLGEKVHDYDVYFRTKETVVAVAEYYVKKFIESPENDNHVLNSIFVEVTEDRAKIRVKSTGVAAEGVDGYRGFMGMNDVQDYQMSDYIEKIAGEKEAVGEVVEEGKPKYRPIFLSSNAITLSDDIQIIIRFWGDADEIHDNFDFAHCTSYWQAWDDELVLRPKAMEAILARELIYVGSKYPLCSIIRTRKFIKRGWIINAGQYLKMAFQLNQLDLTDINVLEEQLIGVDVAYFSEVINRLDNGDDKINSTYLMAIVDKLF